MKPEIINIEPVKKNQETPSLLESWFTTDGHEKRQIVLRAQREMLQNNANAIVDVQGVLTLSQAEVEKDRIKRENLDEKSRVVGMKGEDKNDHIMIALQKYHRRLKEIDSDTSIPDEAKTAMAKYAKDTCDETIAQHKANYRS